MNAKVVRVIDGDTVRFKLYKTFSSEIDFGFHIKEVVETRKSTEMNFRFAGINTPEIRGVSAEVKAQGLAAKAEVERLLSLGSIKVQTYKPGKYGRWLVDIMVYPNDDGEPINVNESLVRDGFAVEYMK